MSHRTLALMMFGRKDDALMKSPNRYYFQDSFLLEKFVILMLRRFNKKGLWGKVKKRWMKDYSSF